MFEVYTKGFILLTEERCENGSVGSSSHETSEE